MGKITITELNRGHAGKIIEDVIKNGPSLVLKNNKPIAIIISVDEYYNLKDSGKPKK